MNVRCKTTDCEHNENGICTCSVVNIDENGNCDSCWIRGGLCGYESGCPTWDNGCFYK